MEMFSSNEKKVGIVMVGAELETATLRTFPALFRLYCSQTLVNVRLVCICAQDCSEKAFKENLEEHLGAGDQEGFLSRCTLVRGDFRSAAVAEQAKSLLSGFTNIIVCFIPHLVVHPEDPLSIAQALQGQCNVPGGWLRCIIEKPLGRDVKSAMELSAGLHKAFPHPKSVFRLDHFLGKEMVQNITALRFANRFLEPSLNNVHVNAVVISCREAKTIRPRTYASYFDKYGIIREIMADHLLHIMALVAMETPVSLSDGMSIRDEVAKVLRCVQPASLDSTVLGQYEGYTETDGVDSDSTTPTFATCVLYINNPRWHGVPFILKAGKGMYEKRTDIRVQFKPPHNMLFPPSTGGGPLNELVIRVQPHRDIYLKMMRKVPGTKFNVAPTKLDLIGPGASLFTGLAAIHMETPLHDAPETQVPSAMDDLRRRPDGRHIPINSYMPDSYERMLYDVVHGDMNSFTRQDELVALWSIFTPLLEKLESDPAALREKLKRYAVGSKGPKESYDLMDKVGFVSYKLDSELLGEKPETVMQRLSRQFSISVYQMEEIVASFREEFEKGLAGDPSSTIKMLPSFVTQVPDGSEKGIYYALDLGGTNFRVSRFQFDGRGGVLLTDERKFTVPDERMTGTAEELFDFLASCVASLNVEADAGKRYYGFTFSFPVEQTALCSGNLLKWTKGFTTSGVVGQDVVELLSQALLRKGFDAKVLSLANDTVGTLISSAYNDPQTMVGVILGTGTNAAYRERVEEITKLPESIRQQGGEMVINTEWGNFGSAGNQLPLSEVDVELDKNSRNVGEQIFEKTISGMYLGEITRLCLVRLYNAKEIWASETTVVPASLHEQHAFESRFLSDVEYDMSDQLKIVERVEKLFGVFNSTLEDRFKLKEVCGMVVQRAAKLTACAIAATLRQIGPERGNGCTVGIDGSVYQHHPSFRLRLSHALGELASMCNITLAKDGSGRGSALIACGALKASSE